MRKLCQRVAQHHRAEVNEEAARLDGWKELGWHQQTPIGMQPTRQDFEADDLSRTQIDDRLEVRNELVALDGPAQFRCQLERSHRRLARGRSECFDPIATSSLGPIHRCVGIAQQVIGGEIGCSVDGKADARGDDQLVPVDRDRLHD